MQKEKRKIFTGLTILGLTMMPAFYFFAYFKPEFFSPDGGRGFLFLIPWFAGQFRGHFLLLAGGSLAFLFGIWRFRNFFERHYPQSLFVLSGLLLLFVLGFAFLHIFPKDELEHVHSAWKIAGGDKPYSGFFQHHHPLLWYQEWPFIRALGVSVPTLFALRFLQFLFFAGILAGTWQIALLLTGKRETGLWALILLLTFKLFVETGIEIRPDVEQTFFCLWAFWLFLKFIRTGQVKLLAASGLLLAIAFFYLQKALFFLFPVGMVFLYLLATKKCSVTAILVFAGSFLIPASFFLMWFFLAGTWKDYLFFNWVINFSKTPVPGIWKQYLYQLCWNPLFLLTFLLSIPYFATKWKGLSLLLRVNFLVGLTLFLIALVNPRPWKQYYFPALPLVAVSAAFMLTDWLKYTPKFRRFQISVIVAVVALPVFLFDIYYPQTNLALYRSINEQRENGPGYVFDEDIRHSLFQRDMHYFWYSTNRGGMYEVYVKLARDPEYSWMLKNRHDDFDLCRLVEKYQPVLVLRNENSDYGLEKCPGVKAAYEEAAPNTFRRTE